MKTITSKQLRQNMDETFEQVNNGQEVLVTHRFKKPIVLSSANSKPKNKKLSGLLAFDKAKKNKIAFDSKKSVKQLYSESILKKYDK